VGGCWSTAWRPVFPALVEELMKSWAATWEQRLVDSGGK
jgi:hypothetical protein